GGNKFVGKARYLQSDESETVKAKTALYLKYYGKAEERIIEDWFSLSTLILIERKANFLQSRFCHPRPNCTCIPSPSNAFLLGNFQRNDYVQRDRNSDS